MFYNKYSTDMFLSKCNSEKIVKFIKCMLSVLKKVLDFFVVALFFIIGNALLNFIAPFLLKSNLFAETQLLSFAPQEALVYAFLSHVLVKFTLKLCFIFVCAKVLIVLVKFFVYGFVNSKENIENSSCAIVNYDGVVCYKSKVQFLN